MDMNIQILTAKSILRRKEQKYNGLHHTETFGIGLSSHDFTVLFCSPAYAGEFFV